ncbi:MAG: hypothetical protein ACOCRX_03475 [Candidatus Woesearchaeota archaeon]
MRITKGFILFYSVMFFIFSYFISSFVPIISLFLILLVMLYHFFLKYKIKKRNISKKELDIKDIVVLFGSIFIIGVLAFYSNNLFGTFFLALLLIEIYFLLNNIYIKTLKKINYVELFFNTFMISFISFNVAYFLLNLISILLGSFRFSILEMIFFYMFPFLFIGFFLRKIGLHIYYTLNRREFSFLDIIKILLNTFKKTFVLFVIILFVYLLVSSIIYFIFVNRYNAILNNDFEFDDSEDIELYELIRSDSEFSLPVYYDNQKRNEIDCDSNLSYHFSNILDDNYLNDIFCAYGRISYFLISDEDLSVSVNHSSGLITKEEDFYIETLNNIKKNSKVFYLISSYSDFFNSFEVYGD